VQLTSQVSLALQVSLVRDAGGGPGVDAGGSVVGRDGVVDVDDQAGLVTRVLAGDLGGRAGCARAGARHAELGATHVVLGTAVLFSGVQRSVLRAHQVLAGGQVIRQVEREVGDTAAAGGVRGPLDTLLRFIMLAAVSFSPVQEVHTELISV
jgi:hypothetical protein